MESRWPPVFSGRGRLKALAMIFAAQMIRSGRLRRCSRRRASPTRSRALAFRFRRTGAEACASACGWWRSRRRLDRQHALAWAIIFTGQRRRSAPCLACTPGDDDVLHAQAPAILSGRWSSSASPWPSGGRGMSTVIALRTSAIIEDRRSRAAMQGDDRLLTPRVAVLRRGVGQRWSG